MLPAISSKRLTPENVNAFFRDFYSTTALGLTGILAREHTAQVDADLRQRREDDFKEARLPILYCSPTMELGVDIRDLAVVHLRNVPPTPANYAQRSGRANTRLSMQSESLAADLATRRAGTRLI